MMLEANLADHQVVQYVIRRFGIHAKHKLGQNFLIRPDVVSAIAEAAELGEHVPVMEIGAGIGTLTQALRKQGLTSPLLNWTKVWNGCFPTPWNITKISISFMRMC